MTGHYEYLAAKTIYENSAAHDKTLVFCGGGISHVSHLQVMREDPGEFDHTIKTLYRYADK